MWVSDLSSSLIVYLYSQSKSPYYTLVTDPLSGHQILFFRFKSYWNNFHPKNIHIKLKKDEFNRVLYCFLSYPRNDFKFFGLSIWCGEDDKSLCLISNSSPIGGSLELTPRFAEFLQKFESLRCRKFKFECLGDLFKAAELCLVLSLCKPEFRFKFMWTRVDKDFIPY